ncbi:MAG: hypothetical protein AAB011_05580 [Candidatus Eisenbacteria bacterium]
MTADGEAISPGEPTYGYGLTERKVLRLQDIIRKECGVELTMEAAWARAIELVALARMLAEADLPPEVRR